MSRIVSWWSAAIALALSPTVGALAAQGAKTTAPGAVWLRVVDADQEPLAGAEIVLPTLGVSMKVPTGGALLLTDVPAGVYLVQARQVGYAPAWRTLRVGRDTIAAQLALGPLGQSLDPVNVTAESVGGRLVDFERRRAHSSAGHFVTRDEIDRRKPYDVASILRAVPGVQVTTSAVAPPQITSRRIGSQRCVGMLVFLDGVLVSGRPDLQSNIVLGATPPPVSMGTVNGAARTTTTVVTSSGGSGSGDPTRGTPGSGSGTTPPSGGTTGGTSAPTGGSGTLPTAGGLGASGRRVFGEPDWAALAGPRGVGSSSGFDINTVPTSLIAGIEVYNTIGAVPAEYAGFIGSQCGVILMWTAAR